MTTMHLIPIAPAPPRTPGKVGRIGPTLTSLSPAAKCVFLPLQPAVTSISETELQSSAKRLQGLGDLGLHTPSSGSGTGKSKKKIHFSGLSYTLPKPQSAAVVRRNERERNRVRKVNVGFAKLRDHVPGGAKNKKLSKVETLRSAVEYIAKLQQMLEDDGAVVRRVEPTITTKQSNATPPLDNALSSSSSAGLEPQCAGSVCSTSDSMSIVDSVCSPSSVDTMGQSPEPYETGHFAGYVDDSSSPPPSSTEPVSPQHSETDFFDFTTWLVQS